MTRRPLFFKIWSVLIAVLGAYYVSTWINSAADERQHYTLGVGIFCIMMGLGAFILGLIGKPKK